MWREVNLEKQFLKFWKKLFLEKAIDFGGGYAVIIIKKLAKALK